MVTGKEKRVLNLKYLKGKYISDKGDDQTMSKYKCLATPNGVLCNEKKNQEIGRKEKQEANKP